MCKYRIGVRKIVSKMYFTDLPKKVFELYNFTDFSKSFVYYFSKRTNFI